MLSRVNETALQEADRGRLWLRRAMFAWAWLAVAVSVKVLVQGRDHSVYPVFAEASRHWWADQSLYVAYKGLDFFMYSPTLAVALTPLAVTPDWLGGILWNLLSVGLLFWALRVLVRDVLPGRWTPGREAVLLGLVMINSIRGVWSLHSNALLLAAAIFGVAAVARRRWWAAAILLAVPVMIKIWPLALVMLLAAIWPRQLIGRFTAAIASLAALPFLTRPPQTVLWQYHQWYMGLMNMAAERRDTLRDFWNGLGQFIGPVPAGVAPAVQLLTAAAVLGWCLWQARRARSARHLLTGVLAAWLGWQLLFGPGSERLTYIILAPAASWAVVQSFAEGRRRAWSLAAWLMTGLLGTGGVERAILPYVPVAPAVLPLGVIVFLGWLVWHEHSAAAALRSAAAAAADAARARSTTCPAGAPAAGERKAA